MADLIVVDDDAALGRMLREVLGMTGHDVRLATGAGELEAALGRALPDLVVLDVSLPGEDGLSIARRLRKAHDFGIIMLTGAGAVVDRVAGLEVGADDYVTKPFSVFELAARVEAVLRNRRFIRDGMVPFGALTFDLKRWKLFKPNGDEVRLYPTEIDLIAAFATNPGKILSRDDILRLAPAHGDNPVDRSVDTRVTRLRRKLDHLGHDGRLIRTCRGNGYIYRGASGI
ncbi:MAG: response regulator transcription factor [Pseudochelatococcus sp.]|jgi:DNA-binding response OmpR family regulator|uniref:response regulator transcription factor n=1 Tax=Pseudochelatococcus sp. TaxID=2020869 RepID=UPI003D89BB2A